MTVAAINPVVEYVENGVSLNFAVPFPFRANSDLVVERFVGSAAPVTVIPTHVTGAGDPGGGAVTLASSTATARLRIRRRTARTQTVDYTPGDRFPAEVHEGALDKQMMVAQEIDAGIADTQARALMVPVGETIAPLPAASEREGKFLVGGPGGAVIMSSGTGADAGLRADLASPAGANFIGWGDDAVGDLLHELVGLSPRVAGLYHTFVAQMFSEHPGSSPIALNPTVINAIHDGALKIVIAGDSIFEPASPIDYPNGPAEILRRVLQSVLPGVVVSVVNRSIPGRQIRDLINPGYLAPIDFWFAPGGSNGALDNNYWPGGSVDGKSWLEHVEDDAPDIVLMACTENADDDAAPVAANLATLDTALQGWTKPPLMAIVAGLVSSDASEPWASQRPGRQSIAELCKWYAIKRGLPLIDVNTIWRLMVDGVRTDVTPRTVVERDFAGWGDDSKWVNSGVFTLVSGVLTGNGLATRAISSRDFDVGFVATLAGDDAVHVLNFRTRDDVGVWSAQFNWADGFVRLYDRGALVAVSAIPNRFADGSCAIRISVDGPIIEIYVDGDGDGCVDPSPVLRHYDAAEMFAGSISIGFGAGSGAISHFTLAYAPKAMVVSPPWFTDVEMLQDGIHHPTVFGYASAYALAIVRFARLMQLACDRPYVLTAGEQEGALTSDAGGTIGVIADTAVSVNVPTRRWVTVHISLPYLNQAGGAGDGRVAVYVDGAGQLFWWLPVTAAVNQRLFTVSAPLLLDAGRHVVALAWGAQAGMTTGGAGSPRSLAVAL